MFGSVASASSTFGSFLSGLIVARTLGLDGTGSYAFAVWIIAVMTTVTGAGLPMTLSRYLPEVSEADGSRAMALTAFLLRPALLFNVVPTLIALSWGLWLTLRAATVHAGASTILLDPTVCMIIGVACTAQALGDFMKGYLRGVHRLDLVAKLTAAAAAAQLAVTLSGSIFFGVRGALAGYLIGAVLPALSLRSFVGVVPVAAPKLRERVVKYARFRWLTEVATVLLFARTELVFIQVFWGAQAVGLWTVSQTLANLAVQGPLLMTWGLLPHFSDHVGRNDVGRLEADYAAGTRIMAFIIFPACFGLAAIAPELLPLLFGRTFTDAVPSAAVLLGVAALSATASVGSNLILAMERTDVDLYIGLTGAALSVVGGFVLIAPLGIIGAALSRAVAQIAVVAIGTWFFSSRLGFSAPYLCLGRQLVASLLCAATARATLLFIHGWSGLALSMIIGAGVYVLGVRVLRAFAQEDATRLRIVLQRLPLPASGVAHRLMQLALG